MQFLGFLESIRLPFLNTFFSLITHLGGEIVFILVGLVYYWCVNKREGYFVLSVGFLGTLFNQFFKLLFRIPRPWLRDPGFTIVESAREGATGYSFPSGHTQTSVGVFGSVALLTKRRIIRILCIAACILVPFSRMYLGVHTPLDVGVAAATALLLIFGLYPLMGKLTERRHGMTVFLASTLALSVAFLVFVLVFPFSADLDADNYASGLKNAYKMIGCTAGMLLAYLVDERYLHFETKAEPVAQILKLLLGLIPLLAIKEGLRVPLSLLFGGYAAADAVRYFLLTAFAGAVWPMVFPTIGRFVSRLRAKKDS
ncbi:MAG: phosphatase PAP2 family protein [Clostridia bacterium]|nr:phosphatase PAP2 family protein [Clostridia bacterium]